MSVPTRIQRLKGSPNRRTIELPEPGVYGIEDPEPRREAIIVEMEGSRKIWSAVCPHLGGPLLDGAVENDAIRCPWHGYRFNLQSGACQTKTGWPWRKCSHTTPSSSPAPLTLQAASENTNDS